jgi:hypothetical protein
MLMMPPILVLPAILSVLPALLLISVSLVPKDLFFNKINVLNVNLDAKIVSLLPLIAQNAKEVNSYFLMPLAVKPIIALLLPLPTLISVLKDVLDVNLIASKKKKKLKKIF